MKTPTPWFTLCCSFVLLALAVLHAPAAQPPPGENPAHQELRAVRDGLLAAINRDDNAATLAHLHTNVVITWHNAEVSRGHAGVRAYHERVMTGPGKLVARFTCGATVDELTILYPGDTGICFGSTDEHFQLAHGGELKLTGRWTATLLRENGRWLITSLHVSANLFDNPLLTVAKKSGGYVAGAVLLVGVGVGWRLGRRRKSAA